MLNPNRTAVPLDLDFLRRVYRTSAIVILLIGAFVWEGAGRASGLAWLLGGLMSLLALAATEWSIRRFIQPEQASARSLLGVSLLKLAVLIGAVVGAFWAARQGYLNLPWALPGFMVPHLVILLKLAGRKLQEWTRAGGAPRSPEP